MAEARTIAPLVSSQWLAENSDDPGLVVIDIRTKEEYKKGHVPGALNVPFASWATTRGELMLELADAGELFKVIGAAGIESDSRVVLVNKTDDPHEQANTTRVACTLFYAGVKNVAILDGGHNQWLREARPVSKQDVRPRPVAYKGTLDESLFVTKEYVKKRLGQSVIIDARDPSDFFGATQDPYSARPGHIPTAACLPAPWA